MEETCNNRDDDCDGRTDESESGGPLRQPCGTQCGDGVEECYQGSWGACTAPQPIDELCNGADDNCDGRIDENCECIHGRSRQCGTDEGECEFGVQNCVDGFWGECQSSYNPDEHPETCDGLDNDCDTFIDEGCSCDPDQTRSCGVSEGVCEEGLLTCGPGGTWGNECVGGIEPGVELCDGLDNDCDGFPDYRSSQGFGWETDDHENNNACASFSPLYNGNGVNALPEGNWIEGIEWLSPAVGDAGDLNTYPTLYGEGDEDWYGAVADEGTHGCVWPMGQCTFYVRVELYLMDMIYYEDIQQNPEDYGICIITLDTDEQTNVCDAPTADPSSQMCTRGTDWSTSDSAYILEFPWEGTCGADDDHDVRIRVYSPTGMACGHYRLKVGFIYDDDRACPAG